jgi:uncharacterized protein
MEVPRHWRLKKQRYAMVGEICPSCKAPNFPPRAVCLHCGGDAQRSLSYSEQPALVIEERAVVYNR